MCNCGPSPSPPLGARASFLLTTQLSYVTGHGAVLNTGSLFWITVQSREGGVSRGAFVLAALFDPGVTR